jgi:hypothetical protein
MLWRMARDESSLPHGGFVMTQKQQPQQPRKEGKAERDARAKGEFRLLIILAVFVVVSIVGMMVIDHYGTARMGNPMKLQDAADR